MATVFQFVYNTESDFPILEGEVTVEREVVEDGYYHVSIDVDTERTLCGIQCDGDDGIKPGETIKGKVTCPYCISIIEQVKRIRNWR